MNDLLNVPSLYEGQLRSQQEVVIFRSPFLNTVCYMLKNFGKLKRRYAYRFSGPSLISLKVLISAY